MSTKAVWRVRRIAVDHWFETKREAETFIEASEKINLPCTINRHSIGCYINSRQLVEFLKENSLAVDKDDQA
jgi:hypothetical protein